MEVTRRTVIETGTTAPLLTTLPRAALAAGQIDDNETHSPAVKVKLEINGRPHLLALDSRTTLLDALRERLALTGSKVAPRPMRRLHGVDPRPPYQLLPDACGNA
jgi:xanthine dehydrogenase YagT iron-sulfur-binding subunit